MDFANIDPRLLLIPVIMVITAAVKMLGVNSKYLTWVSLILGVVGGLSFYSMDLTGAMIGILLGASTSGLYDLKNIVKEN